jgi:hypothetical protein
MAQHYAEMDVPTHNPLFLGTDALNTCIGICVFYNGGVFMFHVSAGQGIPTGANVNKANVQKVDNFLDTHIVLL